MEWLQDHWVLLSALLAALLGVAKVAVKFTKTEKDDEVVDKLGQVADPLLPGDQSVKK